MTVKEYGQENKILFCAIEKQGFLTINRYFYPYMSIFFSDVTASIASSVKALHGQVMMYLQIVVHVDKDHHFKDLKSLERCKGASSQTEIIYPEGQPAMLVQIHLSSDTLTQGKC